jgi:type VI secretion system protein
MPMEASIFDVLSGQFIDDRPVASVRTDRHRMLSVMSNLNRLFNTRQGSVRHLPDYGLPDIMTIYRDAPTSFDVLRRAVKSAIETYEPRLRRVRVERRDTDPHAMRLVFIVSAELQNGERVRFETTFGSQESARVEPARPYT